MKLPSSALHIILILLKPLLDYPVWEYLYQTSLQVPSLKTYCLSPRQKFYLIETSELFPPQINLPAVISLILSFPLAPPSMDSSLFICMHNCDSSLIKLSSGLWNDDPWFNVEETSLPGEQRHAPLCAIWHHLPLCQSLPINRDGRWWRRSLTKPPVTNIRMKTGHHDEQPASHEWFLCMLIKETPDVTSRCL